MSPEPPELFDWQEAHADRLEDSLRKHGVAKDGSDTGTGKTVVALEVARRMGMIPFVVCPKTVVSAWVEWYQEFFPHMPAAFVLNYEKLRGGKTPFIKKKGKGFDWYLKGNILLIFDEDHRCKAPTSLNSKMMQAAARQGYGMLLLGATSCTDPTEMKAIGYALGLHKGKDWWGWCLRNGCERGRFGGLQFNGGAKTLKYLHDAIYGEKGSRIRVKDLGDAFPESLVVADSYDVSSPEKIDKVYEEMGDELKKLEDREKEDEENALTIQLRARQKVELMKVPVLTELALDAFESGHSVAIFISFRDTLSALEKRLSTEGCSVTSLHGDQDDEERKDAIEEFRTDKARVIVCMTQAGGVGISLHDTEGSFPRVSLISPTFSAIDLKQALGRIHRAGAKSKSVQKIVFAAGTVEEKVCQAVRRKLNNIDLINDDELNPLL
tara:strand:+ start:218 stop:1531 length:1314 start_codon:yes stop_codon:yes gene_type:complete